MKKVIVIIVLIIVSSATFSQSRHFGYKTIKNKDNNFSFPIFDQLSDSSITNKINQHLQLSELEIIVPKASGNFYENISQNKGGLYGGKVDISFQLLRNDKKILSLKFDESACGITCAYWVKYYNFNAGNGDLILLSDLFTIEGFKKFRVRIDNKRFETLKRSADSLRVKGDPDLLKDFLDEEFSCFKEDDLSDFYIRGNSIIIDGDNCLSKNEKSGGYEMECVFHLNEFREFLNDYGKTVFSGISGNISAYHSKNLPQLYWGTLGDSRILMILRPSYKDEIEGIYTYTKYGVGINLKGSLNDTDLSLTELNDDFEENGSIEATFTPNNISGTWTSTDKKRKFRIRLVRK